MPGVPGVVMLEETEKPNSQYHWQSVDGLIHATHWYAPYLLTVGMTDRFYNFPCNGQSKEAEIYTLTLEPITCLVCLGR